MRCHLVTGYKKIFFIYEIFSDSNNESAGYSTWADIIDRNIINTIFFILANLLILCIEL